MMANIARKYVYFELFSTGKKTNKWFVVAKRSDAMLGEIKWYGPWRQYCFFPAMETIFNVGCLNSICEFISEEMEHRKKAKERRG